MCVVGVVEQRWSVDIASSATDTRFVTDGVEWKLTESMTNREAEIVIANTIARLTGEWRHCEPSTCADNKANQREVNIQSACLSAEGTGVRLPVY